MRNFQPHDRLRAALRFRLADQTGRKFDGGERSHRAIVVSRKGAVESLPTEKMSQIADFKVSTAANSENFVSSIPHQ